MYKRLGLEAQQIMLNEIVAKDFGKVAVVLEGRDTAGKTGTIRELTHYLPTPKYGINLSSKPNEHDMRHWFQFWGNKMPRRNQIVFYDRSWYSRSMVQQINGWCTEKQYNKFMRKVNMWEAKQKDVKFIKFWLSISANEQEFRIDDRRCSPLKSWKMSPNDERALSYFDEMTLLKEKVITTTPNWYTIDFNNKESGKLNLITTLVNILSDA